MASIAAKVGVVAGVAVVAGTCAALASPVGSQAPSRSTADVAPPAPSPPRPPTARQLAVSIGERATARSRQRLRATFGCVQVRVRDRKRPLVLLSVTAATEQGRARALLGRVVEDVSRGPRRAYPKIALPATRVKVVNRRYGDRAIRRIYKALTAQARRWVDIPGTTSIPGVALNSTITLSHCPPVTLVLFDGHPPDQIRWAQAKQDKYGADRIKIDIQPATPPPPKPDPL